MRALAKRVSEGDQSAVGELLNRLADNARNSLRPEQFSFMAGEGAVEGAVLAMCGPYDLAGAEQLSYEDPEEHVARQLLIVRRPDGSELLGAALLIGDDDNATWYRQLIESATPVTTLRHVLMFGPTAAPSQAPATQDVVVAKSRAREKLVVIGNGMAGMRTVEELLAITPDSYEITVFGAEPYGNYNRILLSPVLAGEKSIGEIMLNDDAWYAENGINLQKGKEVVRIDRRRRAVAASDGTEAPYDRLLIATGSVPFMLPIPGKDLEGVITFRDIHDVNRMLEAASLHDRAVVIGGGLLGLEAANGLIKNGMQVTVIHLMSTLMERQLDAAAGAMLRGSLEARGLVCITEAKTKEIVGKDGRVAAVRLDDGREIAADLVVMAVGIKPNIALAQAAGLYCKRGIVVDDTMLTYDPRVYAVGECVEHRGQTYGLVAPLFEQAKIAANHLARKAWAAYRGSLTSTKLKVTGIDLFSAGDFSGGAGTEELLLDRKSTRLNSSHIQKSRMPSSA